MDPHGRTIRYLRLSLTRGCSMRCIYCRPAVDHGHEPSALDVHDLEFLVAHLHHRFTLRKLRLTGGEPTTRQDLCQVVARMKRLGIGDVAMTTNGLTLERQHAALTQAGLDRVNVSIDTLDRERFARLTGVDGVKRVVAGIRSAVDAGRLGVKLNAVVVRGENDLDLGALLLFAAGLGVTMRFIELMPMGPLAGLWEQRYVSEARMRVLLEGVVRRWLLAEGGGDAAPDAARVARAELFDGRVVQVGFVTPMSNHFCGSCDRLRLTADGGVYPCLMDESRGNMTLAVKRRDAQEIDRVLAAAYGDKAASHPPAGPAVMTHLGG